MSTRKSNQSLGRQNASRRERDTLGGSWTSARNRLIRRIVFDFLIKSNQDKCFVCKEEMSEDTWSIEHIEPWLDIDVNLFWSLDNITYSHKKCNRPRRQRNGSIKARKVGPEGTAWCSIHKDFDLINNFTFDKSRWNGLSSGCKSCKRVKEQQYYKNKHG